MATSVGFRDTLAMLSDIVRAMKEGDRAVIEVDGTGRVDIRFLNTRGFTPEKTIRCDVHPDGSDRDPDEAVQDLRRSFLAGTFPTKRAEGC